MNLRDITVYLLVRTDMMSMNPGKAMAQAHHAGVQLATKHKDKPIFKEYLKDGIAQGADHFNTTLTLEIVDIDQLKQIINTARKMGCLVDSVIDPEYPFIVDSEIANLISANNKVVKKLDDLSDGRVLMVRPELTMAYVIGDRNKPEFKNIFAELKLHK